MSRNEFDYGKGFIIMLPLLVGLAAIYAIFQVICQPEPIGNPGDYTNVPKVQQPLVIDVRINGGPVEFTEKK
jgi:hypothetical protein